MTFEHLGVSERNDDTDSPVDVICVQDSLDKLVKDKWPLIRKDDFRKTMRDLMEVLLIRKDDFRKTTRDLMEVLFTTEEMATSSVTGSKGHTGSTKDALDPRKIAFIICESS